MFWFLKKQKKPPLIDLETYTGPSRDPLEAVPRPAPRVKAVSRGEDVLELQRRLPSATRWGAKIAKALHMQRFQRVKLDPLGSYYWKQIDGDTSLHDIAFALQRHTLQSLEECRSAVLVFTRDLMTRHMLQLKIDDPEQTEAAS